MTPSTDWVNSTPGKYCIKGEFGPNTPNKRAPLASGGRTRGRITITLITNFPRNPLYLARKYASGIPNRARSEVEIVAETRLRTKAFQSTGLVNESRIFTGSTKVTIETSGNTIYVTVIADRISIRMLKPCGFAISKFQTVFTLLFYLHFLVRL